MRATQAVLFAALAFVGACAEGRDPTTVAEESEVRPIEQGDAARREPMERLARRVALALAEPGFRAYVREALQHSPYRERKLPFSRFLGSEGNRAGLALAAADGSTPAAVAADLGAAGALEFYMPVPAHRTRWQGDDRILVATEVRDHERPVAYDTKGRRILLDPDTTPTTPVLAVVPVETDFDRIQTATSLPVCDTCSTSTGPDQPPPNRTLTPPALHMTYFGVTKDFEGWLKGDPEYEIHVLGPMSGTDTTRYRTLYCIGEYGNRHWDTDAQTWRGDVTVMSGAEIDAFHTAFPNSNVSFMAVEDDDTACEIKVDQDRMSAMLTALDRAFVDFKGARDSLGLNGKTFIAAKSSYDFLAALANFFKTNDDVIGVAVANSVTGYYSPDANWGWWGENAYRYGLVKLEMR